MNILDSYELHLRAEGKSPKTQRTYLDAVAKFTREQRVSGVSATKQDIEQHIVSLLDRYSPAYASNQGRALRVFFKWLAEEEGIDNPMAGLKLPNPEPPAVPVFGEGEIDALLRTCRGRARKDRRDTALILMLRDTGARLSEVANLTVDDIDLRNREALVTGKAQRQRFVKFGSVAAVAVDRWLRMSNPAPGTSIWGIQANGCYQAIRRRAVQAGLKGVHPHRFRHDFSHRWLANGGAEGDLMSLNGWRSAQMLRRYGASAAASRARRSYDKIMG